METAYWNDYYLKRKGKSSSESKDLSAACESFNSGNEINRKLKKSQVFTFKRTQVQGKLEAVLMKVCIIIDIDKI